MGQVIFKLCLGDDSTDSESAIQRRRRKRRSVVQKFNNLKSREKDLPLKEKNFSDIIAELEYKKYETDDESEIEETEENFYHPSPGLYETSEGHVYKFVSLGINKTKLPGGKYYVVYQKIVPKEIQDEVMYRVCTLGYFLGKIKKDNGSICKRFNKLSTEQVENIYD